MSLHSCAGEVAPTSPMDEVRLENARFVCWQEEHCCASTLLDQSAVERALARMAREILERNEGTRDLVLLGIRRRGVELSERIRGFIKGEEGVEISSGAIDITLYRDDHGAGKLNSVMEKTNIPFPLDGMLGYRPIYHLLLNPDPGYQTK